MAAILSWAQCVKLPNVGGNYVWFWLRQHYGSLCTINSVYGILGQVNVNELSANSVLFTSTKGCGVSADNAPEILWSCSKPMINNIFTSDCQCLNWKFCRTWLGESIHYLNLNFLDIHCLNPIASRCVHILSSVASIQTIGMMKIMTGKRYPHYWPFVRGCFLCC